MSRSTRKSPPRGQVSLDMLALSQGVDVLIAPKGLGLEEKPFDFDEELPPFNERQAGRMAKTGWVVPAIKKINEPKAA